VLKDAQVETLCSSGFPVFDVTKRREPNSHVGCCGFERIFVSYFVNHSRRNSNFDEGGRVCNKGVLKLGVPNGAHFDGPAKD
jgi:hypothetical protein